MNLVLAETQLPLRLRPAAPMSDADLLRFSGENDSVRVERDENGDLLIMTPTGSRTGRMNMRLSRLLDEWAEADGRGFAFDSSTGFKLPDGSVRSPDAAWIAKERWQTLTDQEQMGYGPLCPDFVIELVSPTDRLADVQKKMEQAWIANGAPLGWIIDPETRTIGIYRLGEATEVHVDPTSVQGTGPVRGFELVLNRLWN